MIPIVQNVLYQMKKAPYRRYILIMLINSMTHKCVSYELYHILLIIRIRWYLDI